VGFLGAAQIDRHGNVNTTVIGDYGAPRTRLPGSGGACEIALNAREVFVVMRQSRRSFVGRLDFRTSPGNLAGRTEGAGVGPTRGWSRRGPSVVVTDLAVYGFDDDGEMRLVSLHPGVAPDDVRAATGWAIRMAADAPLTPPPSPEELRLIREVLDGRG
jgi:glutaconate CoA-transferase subunit B